MSHPSAKTRKDHRDMYKAKTPPWKETYRKRCMERLKESRAKLQDKFRKIVQKDIENLDEDEFITDLMKDELRNLQRRLQDDKKLQDIDMDDIIDPEFDVDNMLSLFEDIQKELRLEERKLLEEFESYEASMVKEENLLCSAVERLCTEEVICPICQKNSLLQNKSVIFCKCGMRVNTEQDGMTLSNVKTFLDTGIKQHGEVCESNAIFSVVQDLGTQNLMMSCKEKSKALTVIIAVTVSVFALAVAAVALYVKKVYAMRANTQFPIVIPTEKLIL